MVQFPTKTPNFQLIPENLRWICNFQGLRFFASEASSSCCCCERVLLLRMGRRVEQLGMGRMVASLIARIIELILLTKNQLWSANCDHWSVISLISQIKLFVTKKTPPRNTNNKGYSICSPFVKLDSIKQNLREMFLISINKAKINKNEPNFWYNIHFSSWTIYIVFYEANLFLMTEKIT